MSAPIVVSCPHCKKQIKVPADVQGKKIRCKGCSEVFAAKPAAAGTKTAGAKPTGQKPAAAKPDPAKATKPVVAAPPPPQPKPADDDDGPASYGVTVEDLTARCPHCAAALESEDAVVCLECGYNTITRQRVSTKRTIENTQGDYFSWLLPGFLCVLGIFAIIGATVFLWTFGYYQKDTEDAFYNNFIFAGQTWGTVMAIYFIWLAGKFAFGRLVLNPHPPEFEKK